LPPRLDHIHNIRDTCRNSTRNRSAAHDCEKGQYLFFVSILSSETTLFVLFTAGIQLTPCHALELLICSEIDHRVRPIYGEQKKKEKRNATVNNSLCHATQKEIAPFRDKEIFTRINSGWSVLPLLISRAKQHSFDKKPMCHE
jgi:hypothetical protein